VGAPWNPLILGKHSGRHAVQKRCSELGFELEGSELVEVYRALMVIADDRKILADNDIIAVVSSVRTKQPAAQEPIDPFDTPAATVQHALHESGYGHGV
jgi:2-isopropylmalate synthase